MGTGKFFPGGGKRNKGEESDKAPEPIRAEEAPKKPSGGLFPGARTRFAKPIDSRQKPIAVIISVVFCVIFISIGWYYGAVRPARLQAQQLEIQVAALKQQKLEEQKKVEEMKKAEEDRKATARGTVKVDTKPPKLKVLLGDVGKISPAVFEGVMPGQTTLTVAADGYRTVTRTITVVGDEVTDLGIIELVVRSGSIKLSSPQSGASYTLTGPNNFSRSGTIPAAFDNLPEGNYTVAVLHKGWQLSPTTLTVTDAKETAHEFKFGYGSITIQSEPSGATVKRDRTSIGQTPLTLSDLRPGIYKYTLEKEGHRTVRIQVDLKEFGAETSRSTLEKTRDFVNANGVALVWIDSGFWAGRYEVTQAQFEKILGHAANTSVFRGPNRPVENVTWARAMEFCEKLTQAEQAAGKLPAGYKYTLPTENQFNEYLGDTDFSSAVMGYNGAPASTADVGSSDPNSLGVYDALGNVWEWCLDNFDADGRAHVMRGGGWLSTRESFPNKAVRNGGLGDFRDKYTGFRVVLTKSN